jgi:hypothetical protein
MDLHGGAGEDSEGSPKAARSRLAIVCYVDARAECGVRINEPLAIRRSGRLRRRDAADVRVATLRR